MQDIVPQLPQDDKIAPPGGDVNIADGLALDARAHQCAEKIAVRERVLLKINRAVGENPNAASSVGVSVLKIKYIAIAYSGLMAGFGGAFMSMSYAQGWSLDMVAGRGFIALAAQAMGSGECLGGMLSSLIFGFAQALGIKFSAIGLDSNLASPIPYAVTIIGLLIFALAQRRGGKRRNTASLKKAAAKAAK